ncbi:uncharacterized protein LOC125495508 [Beta vulgaris subsp. vulgaris]|uniref:uncharacterized protein LOC125495508 n=1 Tax=Beta vulgaris subsp. vulgaris TaxID=3555 RepID=UPI0020370C06|nr:uncharacterized protein LOC125495508 [Beta vulgaris subsp. vulgaris]
MLVSWITNTIDPEVSSTLSYYDNAKVLWDDLHERYSVVNGTRIHQLKSNIIRCEQSKTMPVATYYGKLKVLWDELALHEPPLVCQYGDLGPALLKRRDSDHLHQFLFGLYSDYYGTIRSSILSHDPLPTLNKAYQQISQEERVRGFTRLKDEKPDVLGFAVRTDSRAEGRGRGGAGSSSRPDKSGLICSHCHKTGHDDSTCFSLHGTPDWWYERYGNKAENNFSRGRGRNPTPPASTSRCRGPVRANATPTDPPPASGPSSSIPAITPEQWQALFATFGNSSTTLTNCLSGKFELSSWIIDTGCSHHVTGDISHLRDIVSIVDCLVGLPNGATVLATRSGTVHLSDTLVLHDVLYVPNLQCNLISVTQLSDTLSCFVTFSTNICAIQDLHSRALIGTGERQDGLYYFRQHHSALAVSVPSSAASTLALWHSRLGHPFEAVVKLLPFVSSSPHLDKGCNVCHKAKQPKCSFSVSDTKASRIFEMVHCDLWGPYSKPSSCGSRYF